MQDRPHPPRGVTVTEDLDGIVLTIPPAQGNLFAVLLTVSPFIVVVGVLALATTLSIRTVSWIESGPLGSLYSGVFGLILVILVCFGFYGATMFGLYGLLHRRLERLVPIFFSQRISLLPHDLRIQSGQTVERRIQLTELEDIEASPVHRSVLLMLRSGEVLEVGGGRSMEVRLWLLELLRWHQRRHGERGSVAEIPASLRRVLREEIER